MKTVPVCYFVAGFLFFMILGAILSLIVSDQEEERGELVQRVRCGEPLGRMRERLAYSTSVPNPQQQQQLMKRAQVAENLQNKTEKIGPVYQDETENAMKVKPVPKEKFTNSFIYDQEPPTVRDSTESPYLGQIRI